MSGEVLWRKLARGKMNTIDEPGEGCEVREETYAVKILAEIVAKRRHASGEVVRRKQTEDE